MLPRIPCLIAIVPDAIFDIAIGIVNGETLFAPLATKVLIWLSIVQSPPIPEPNITPILSLFISSKLRLLSLIDSLAAITANWVYLSILLDSFLSIKSLGSKSLTSAAIFTFKFSALNKVISSIPFLPSLIPSQKLSTLFPIGVIAPRPVITTLLFNFKPPFMP